ncbi:MAG TPA: alpha/beta hydrolase [Candidatus Saccharimonadales bacterium]|nr:alpha/beta hydrolase [Candidatus Saccharimonadales bacterium]
MPPKKNIVNIHGLNLTYYTFGAGKPMLFLHGGRVRALTFKKNLELLAKNFFVIAPDIPGYGFSATPKDVWSFIDYAKFFDYFLSKLDLKNVTVIGYSMGGGIAYNMAGISKRLDKVVLINSSGMNIKVHKVRSDLKRLEFYLTHPKYLHIFIVLLKEYCLYYIGHIMDLKIINRIRTKCGDTIYDAYKTIKIPTLILWSDEDWIFPIAVGKRFNQKIPHSKLEIVQGNHDWILYNPILFSQILLKKLTFGHVSVD